MLSGSSLGALRELVTVAGICCMEMGQLAIKVQVIRYKTNIHVYHAHLDHCAGLLDREDFIYVSLDKMLL
jgi:hypothetical protein